MRKLALTIAASFSLLLAANAQKKEINFAQAFENAPTGISQPLPQIVGWDDDAHYIEARRGEGRSMIRELVNIKTGERKPYSEEPEAVPAINPGLPKEAKNATYSPDGKKIAYTLDNNLFVKDLTAGDTRQITSDGSSSIKNGYASWVYFEEIRAKGPDGRSRDLGSITFVLQ